MHNWHECRTLLGRPSRNQVVSEKCHCTSCHHGKPLMSDMQHSHLSDNKKRQQDGAGDGGCVEGQTKHVQLLRQHLQHPQAAFKLLRNCRFITSSFSNSTCGSCIPVKVLGRQ